MSIANPTGLQLGDVGTLAGKRYRVAGRVVLSTLHEGERWYWNEFNLIDDAGNSATLVHEDEGDASPWKLFTDLKPQFPMSATEAADKRVGDEVNITGGKARITLVGESRVEFIEGEAPEGVEMNDVAHYFNADVAGQMIVVSWTGDEVEFFRGMDLPTHAIRQAFGTNAAASRFIPLSAQAATDGGMEDSGAQWRWLIPFFFAASMIGIVLARLPSCRSGSSRSIRAIEKPATVVTPLAVGQSGTLEGILWTIRGHAVVEIAQVGAKFDYHDYRLEGADNVHARLMLGHAGKPREWMLFAPMEPDALIMPVGAAAMRVGQLVKLDGTLATVERVFQTTVIANHLDSPGTTGEVRFNLIARSGDTPLLLSWNAGNITFHRGTALRDQQVMEAFNPVASKPR